VKWTDVDLEGGMIWVHGDPLTGTKNWERRQVPIIPAMRRLLEDLRNNPRAVRDVNSLNANFVLAVTECLKAIDAACAKLGIKTVVHRDLRHLFAAACIETESTFRPLQNPASSPYLWSTLLDLYQDLCVGGQFSISEGPWRSIFP
jgi:integrase